MIVAVVNQLYVLSLVIACYPRYLSTELVVV